MLITGTGREFIIKDTHRGLWYEDGKLTKVLEAGRYKIPPQKRWFKRLPTVECLLVDVRQRELTIKGQEILTADKVAIRVRRGACQGSRGVGRTPGAAAARGTGNPARTGEERQRAVVPWFRPQRS